jgi:hypothetical protein
VTNRQIFFYAVFAVCCIAGNVFHYRAKFFLRAQRFPVSFFTDHWKDLRHLKQVAESGADPLRQMEAHRLRSRIIGWYTVSALAFAVVAIEQIFRIFP